VYQLACTLDAADIVEVSWKHKETLCPRRCGEEYIAMAIFM
jgi:hypothetical protein